jgi:hypothetical protein
MRLFAENLVEATSEAASKQFLGKPRKKIGDQERTIKERIFAAAISAP